ncbi:agamous-like MADS-box protein AGL80 [Senna tora]|uniref:Agamous-like MADS-box protein AGL80 n=1 Tax=Senna tora TaxID=362788 RepID=A0A834TGH9_9FABA|nr:agamous-like MADS-box protein AGL80 [Senna tora]
MGRKKVTFEYITDYQKRKLSFKKRQEGLKKKPRELSILCGVDVVAVVYNALSDPHSEVSPDDRGVHRFLDKYHDPTIVSENALRLKMLVEQNLKEIDRVMEASGKEDEVPSCWNGMEDLEYYLGFGSSEMPQDFDQNDNYQNAASSSNSPFYKNDVCGLF